MIVKEIKIDEEVSDGNFMLQGNQIFYIAKLIDLFSI